MRWRQDVRSWLCGSCMFRVSAGCPSSRGVTFWKGLAQSEIVLRWWHAGASTSTATIASKLEYSMVPCCILIYYYQQFGVYRKHFVYQAAIIGHFCMQSNASRVVPQNEYLHIKICRWCRSRDTLFGAVAFSISILCCVNLMP